MLSYSASSLQLRARAQLELRRRQAAGELTGRFDAYRFDAVGYLRDQLGWEPWRGEDGEPGQADVADAYSLALRQQHERQDVEAGRLDPDACVTYRPTDEIRRVIRVESGHGIGKTTLLAGLVSHFFDCFDQSIVYCFAPTHEQINDLLFKEIRRQRRGRGLPGRVLETPEVKGGPDHFVKGRATNDAGGKGTERVQGQHAPYLLFVLDEAEGVPDFIFGAIDSMASGGISIILLAANPRTRTSRFHRLAAKRDVVSFRVSCVNHPNVRAGRTLIPGAVERAYVESMIDNGETQHCEVVATHDPDAHTFELPWRPGVIYRPDAEFLFRVLGIAPALVSVDTFCPIGRYEAARRRRADTDQPHVARIGVDVARWGTDSGAIWLRHNGAARRVARLDQQDTTAYVTAIKTEAKRLASLGVADLRVRVDGGGGFGGGVVDQLRRDEELRRLFSGEYEPGKTRVFQVLEVNFNAASQEPKRFADLITEATWHACEALKALALVSPPATLEEDLCERRYGWAKLHGLDVKKLEPKEEFRKRHDGRSPDDGDGYVLAAAPDHLFVDRKGMGVLVQGKARGW